MEVRRQISIARTAGLLAIAVAWALLLAFTGTPEAILFTVPVFLLAAPLALGRYPGESLIEKIRTGSDRHVASGDRPLPLADEASLSSHLTAGSTFGRAPPAIA